MGTTARGMRYPEGTVIGNTMHTHIKNLADDVNTQLNAVKLELLGRQTIEGAHAGGTFSNTGTDFAFGTVNLTIPSGTELIKVRGWMNASSAQNAAAYWRLQARTAAGVWFNIDNIRVHNNAVPATPLSALMEGSTTPAELGNPASTFQVRMIISVDAGGAAISAGPLSWSAQYTRVN